MDNYIILFATLANVIAILLVYYSFGRKMDKQKKFINTLISIGFVYILVWITFLLSSIGIEEVSGLEQAKTLMTIAFVPVNAILFIPFVANSYIKRKDKKIDDNNFNRRMIIVAVLAVVVLVCEFFYFRNFQTGIVELKKQIQNNQVSEQNIETNSTDNIISNELNEEIDSTNKLNEQADTNSQINNELGINNVLEGNVATNTTNSLNQ